MLTVDCFKDLQSIILIILNLIIGMLKVGIFEKYLLDTLTNYLHEIEFNPIPSFFSGHHCK